MTAPRTHRARRTISAPAETLYRSLVEPELLENWLAPDGARLKVEHLDAQPGGAYRFVLSFDSYRGKSGDRTDVVEGRFVALVPFELVQTESDFVSDDPAFAGTMRMSWHFTPAARGTLVEVVAENVPPGITAEEHEPALASSLANLARYAEQP
ncbi:MAG: SRPBCC domain-containing protein [Maritimibacter sp.]|nr:SRPBCC domain-containing protein [Maritimibacter sp.]